MAESSTSRRSQRMTWMLAGILAIPAVVLLVGCAAGGGEQVSRERGDAINAALGAEAESGVAKGTVTDTNGEPLEGAEIYVYGLSTEAGSQVQGTAETDADGDYSLEVPDGEFELSGDIPVEFDGERWRDFPLHPIDSESEVVRFDGADGLVQDFEWRLSGLVPGKDPDNAFAYYGGHIEVNYIEEDVGTTPEDAVFSFVLTPKGPLADGSEIDPSDYERTYAELSGQDDDSGLKTGSTLHDIPLGTYTLSGEMTFPDGSTLPLSFDRNFEDGSEALEIAFEPDATSAALDVVRVNARAPGGASEDQYDNIPEPWNQSPSVSPEPMPWDR